MYFCYKVHGGMSRSPKPHYFPSSMLPPPPLPPMARPVTIIRSTGNFCKFHKPHEVQS